MENRRDSSVWQSLAITFGGGLALGAVGMRLTQDARRAPAASVESATQQPAERPAALDPRLLDAVIAAVDARLHDHTVQTERRIQEVQNQFQGQMAAVRVAVGEELNAFGEAVSKLMAEQVGELVDARGASLEQTLEPRVIAAVKAALELELAPLRAGVYEKERELSEMRQRLQESEHTMLEVIAAIGAACQKAAERVSATPSMQAPMPGVSPMIPAGPAVSEAGTTGETGSASGPAPDEIPAFGKPAQPARLWRIPMVSSFVGMAIGLLLLRYL
jgi:hypothetical protein